MFQHPETEKIFTSKLQQEINNIEVPEFQEVWVGLKKRHLQERSKRRRKLLLQAAVIFLCIISAVSMFKPGFVTALSSRVEKIILQRQDGTMEVRTKVAKEDVITAKTPPPPPEMEEPQPEQFTVSFSEAQLMTPFHLVYPQYLPEGYECTKVDIVKFDQHYDVREFFQSGENYFSIQQQNILGEMASTRGFPSDVKISEISILDNSATLVEFSKGNIRTVLFWDTPNMQWEIMGTISAEEIIDVAKSLK